MREITFGRDAPAESSHNDFVQAPLLLIIIIDNKGFQTEQKDLFSVPETSSLPALSPTSPFSLSSEHLLYIVFLVLSSASWIIDSRARPADAKKRTTRWFDTRLL